MKSLKLPASLITALYILLLLAAVLPLLYRNFPQSLPPTFVINGEGALDKNPSSMTIAYACEDCLVPAVHGSNAIETTNGGLLATWFGGSREGGKDVVLWGSDYSPGTMSWSVPRQIISPAQTKAALGRYIKTVGNSVLVRGIRGELWLYYVTVSVGGWAGASLNAILSNDDGKTWDAPRRLITSPFFNISTLNKSVPVYYSDGSIGLPVYHEFMGKFAELLRISNTGEVLDKIRITHGRHSIQPLVLPLSTQEAVTLMRNTNATPGTGRVLISRSDNAGQNWTGDERLEFHNADSAVGGLRRPDGSLLLVFNDGESGRSSLALALSRDQGKSWIIVKHFERNADVKSEFSYPYLIRSSNGTMHLLYTWNRKRIRHIAFNDNWVDGGQP